MTTPEVEPSPSSRPGRGLGIVLVLALLLVAGLFLRQRVRVSREAQARHLAQEAGRTVAVHTVALSAPVRQLQIQGEALPFASTTLFAKSSGIVAELQADRGDRVRAGQLLARLVAPELDQDIQGAEADAALKRENARRARALFDSALLARKDLDQAMADLRVSESKVNSLKAQRDYLVIRAPFTGTVTARFVDPGTLVQNASANQTSAQPLFTISQVDRLRIAIYLDQRVATRVKAGTPVVVQFPGQKDQGVETRISRVTGQADAKTRMMLAEIDLDNAKGQFLAGGLVQVRVKLELPQLPEVPVEALIRRGENVQVAVVGADNRLALRAILLADEDPRSARIRQGLQSGERVALNAADFAADGFKIQMAAPVGPPSSKPRG